MAEQPALSKECCPLEQPRHRSMAPQNSRLFSQNHYTYYQGNPGRPKNTTFHQTHPTRNISATDLPITLAIRMGNIFIGT